MATHNVKRTDSKRSSNAKRTTLARNKARALKYGTVRSAH